MPTPKIDPQTAQALLEQLLAITGKSTSVTEAQATAAYCHCNADDCERCIAAAKRGHELVLAAHERMYPGLREAAELAELGSPVAAARALKKQEATIAELVAMVMQLTAGQQQMAAAIGKLAPPSPPQGKPAGPPPGVPTP